MVDDSGAAGHVGSGCGEVEDSGATGGEEGGGDPHRVGWVEDYVATGWWGEDESDRAGRCDPRRGESKTTGPDRVPCGSDLAQFRFGSDLAHI